MKQKQRIAFILLLAVFFVPAACGKKGPPFLSAGQSTLRVEQLKAEREGGFFHLKGTVVDSHKLAKDVSNVTGCRIYHACYPLDEPPCEGCPIEYGVLKEIKGEIITQGKFSCQVPLKEKAGIHFFKVRLIGRMGETGPYSDRAKLVIYG